MRWLGSVRRLWKPLEAVYQQPTPGTDLINLVDLVATADAVMLRGKDIHSMSVGYLRTLLAEQGYTVPPLDPPAGGTAAFGPDFYATLFIRKLGGDVDKGVLRAVDHIVTTRHEEHEHLSSLQTRAQAGSKRASRQYARALESLTGPASANYFSALTDLSQSSSPLKVLDVLTRAQLASEAVREPARAVLTAAREEIFHRLPQVAAAHAKLTERECLVDVGPSDPRGGLLRSRGKELLSAIDRVMLASASSASAGLTVRTGLPSSRVSTHLRQR